MTTNFKPDSKGFIMGTDGDDEITWQESWDKAITVNAIGGNDTLNFSQSTYNNKLVGGPDNDTIYGGSGNDTLVGDAGEDYLDGSLGDDVLYGGDNNNTLKGQSGNDSIFGGNDDDRIYGGNGHDTILSGGGNDIIFGDSGQDFIKGGAGDDKITGGAGSDYLYGGEGNDTIFGSEGRNNIYGDEGNDSIKGGVNTDIISAGEGNDFVDGGAGNDILYGNSGLNTIRGGSGHDEIHGGTDKDVIRGGEGNDTIWGGAGNDNIRGEAGNNIIKGGEGHDFIAGGTGNDTIYGGEGNDDIYGIEGHNVLRGEDGDDRITGGTGIDKIYGGEGKDFVTGGTGSDKIYGESGNDSLYGGDDDDFIDGGEGDDSIIGGAGDDTITGGSGNDTFVFEQGSGVDTITDAKSTDKIKFINASFSDMEFTKDGTTLKITIGSDIINVNGYFNNDGSVADDVIETFNVGDVDYTLQWLTSNVDGSENMYNVTSDPAKIINGIQNWVNTGVGNDSIIGGDKYDMLAGNQGNDTISASVASEIYGGEGNDLISAASGSFIDGGLGNDNITVSGGSNTILFVNTGVADADFKKFGVDTLTGATSSDRLVFALGQPGQKIGYSIDALSFTRNDNNLIITADDNQGNNGQVNIKDFFISESKVDTFYTIEGKKSIINDVVFDIVLDNENFDKQNSLYKDFIVRVSGNGSVSNLGDNDIVSFDDELVNLSYKRNGNDLVINNITINDYYTSKDMSVAGQYAGLVLDTTDSSDTTLGALQVTTIENVSDIIGSALDENITLVKGTVDEIDDVLSGNTYTSNADDNEYTVNAYANGGSGNDVISGTDDGNDWINGGEGNDTIIDGTSGHDMISGGDGNDTIIGSSQNTVGSEYYGAEGNDNITGTAGNDFIWGGAGNDTIELQNGGADTIMVADEADGFTETVRYADSNDTLKLTKGDAGYAFSDLNFERNQNDLTINTDNGQINVESFFVSDSKLDNIITTNGNKSILNDATINVALDDGDSYTATEYKENITLNGSSTIDFTVGCGNETVTLGENSDVLLNFISDTSENHYISTYTVDENIDDGSITITRKTGTKSMFGITPVYTDTLTITDYIANGQGNVTFNGTIYDNTTPTEGLLENIISTTKDNYHLSISQNVAAGQEFQGSWLNERIIGTSSNDTIYGNDGNDYIDGAKGNDLIYGGNGDDFIDGKHGSDAIYGEDGNDTLKVSAASAGDTNTIYGGKGDDTINVVSNYDDNITHIYAQEGEDSVVVNGKKGTIYLHDLNSEDSLQHNVISEAEGGAEYTYSRDGQNLVITQTNNTNTQSMIIENHFTRLAGGTQIDEITIGGADISLLNDATINVNLEDGATYTTTGYNENLILSAGNTNTLVLTENAKVNITMTGVTEGSAVLNNGTLTISDDENEGTLIIQNYLQYGEGNVTFSNGTITNAALEDVIWSSAKLPSPLGENYDVFYKNAKSSVTAGVAFEGTFLADYINGTTSADTISGGAGRDHIVGKAGNDIITGGDGNDYLSGDAGNDTYINTDLNYYDQVYDSAGDDDCIYITGVNKDDLILYFDLEQDGGSIVAANSKKLYISNNDDFGAVYADDADKKGISVNNYFTSSNYNIERIETADGYYMTTTQINSLRESTAGWLADNGFTSIQQIVNSGVEEDISALIAQLKTANWQDPV